MTRQDFSPLVQQGTDVLDEHVWHRTTALIDQLQAGATDQLSENLKQGANARDLSKHDVLTFRLTRDYDLTDQATIDATEIPIFSVTLKNDAGNEGTINDIEFFAHNIFTPTRPQVCKIKAKVKQKDGTEKEMIRDVTKIFFETYQIPLDKFQIPRDKCTELIFKFGPSVGAMRVVIDEICFIQFEPKP